MTPSRGLSRPVMQSESTTSKTVILAALILCAGANLRHQKESLPTSRWKNTAVASSSSVKQRELQAGNQIYVDYQEYPFDKPGDNYQSDYEELCLNDPTNGLQCFSCLQWECRQGYFAPELPFCYSFLWTLYDDYRPEIDIYVNICSTSTCCKTDFTDVFNCQGYYECPDGSESSLVVCTSKGTNPKYPPCVEDVCCVEPIGQLTTAPTYPPTTATTDTPIGVPSQATPAPTRAPTRQPATAPTPRPTTAPTEAPTGVPPQATSVPTREPSRQPTTAPITLLTTAPARALTRTPISLPEPATASTHVATDVADEPPSVTPSTSSPPSTSMTCDSFLARGDTRETGYTFVDGEVKCGQHGCDQKTCCAEGVAPTNAPPNRDSLSPIHTGEPTSEEAPTIIADIPPQTSTPVIVSTVVHSRSVTTAAVSVLALSGMGVIIAGSMFGGAASLAMPIGASSSSAVVRTRKTGGAVAGKRSVRTRPPSVAMAILLVAQVQFLATLSLVASIRAENSWFSDVISNLRWINIWPPPSFARSFLTSDGNGIRKLLEEDDTSGCLSEKSSPSDIGTMVFLGNLGIFVAILLGIFVIHIVLASALDAYWLSQQLAKEEMSNARRGGIAIRDVAARAPGTAGQQPDGDEFSPSLCDNDLAPRVINTNSFGVGVDREENEMPSTRHPKTRWAFLADRRDQSRPGWLYFPHMELLFLLFAFQGAVASQVATLRDSRCLWVISMAAVALVFYPVLLVAMSYRTHRVRVVPGSVIVFKPAVGAECDVDFGAGDNTPSFISRVKNGLRQDHSLFVWADKGAWETVETGEEETRRKAHRFRIGFEPLFVDFTKNSAWFMVYSLFEIFAISCTTVLVDESALQLFLFCILHSSSFLVLMIFKSFANSVIDKIGAGLAFTDAISMALLGTSAAVWEGTRRATHVDMTIAVVQLMTLVVLIVPIYVDSLLALAGAVGQTMVSLRKREKRTSQAEVDDEKEERRFIRSYIVRAWAFTWFSMLGRNVSAC